MYIIAFVTEAMILLLQSKTVQRPFEMLPKQSHFGVTTRGFLIELDLEPFVGWSGAVLAPAWNTNPKPSSLGFYLVRRLDSPHFVVDAQIDLSRVAPEAGVLSLSHVEKGMSIRASFVRFG